MGLRLDDFDSIRLEKVEHLFEILESISEVKFLRERLAFYGGTCLNFSYFDGVPRLSVDLDFNYRSQDGTLWEDDWLPIDDHLKEVLYDLGYDADDIHIQAEGPLKRMTVDYGRSSGGLDSVDVEIGYLRRMPFLQSDEYIEVQNPITSETCRLRAPQREELFANKFCTMLYRDDPKNPRDAFDVYTFSALEFDRTCFRTLAIMDSLTRPEPKNPRLSTVDVATILDSISIDDQLKNLLRNRKPPSDLKSQVRQFSEGILRDLTEEEIEVIDGFHDNGRMKFHRLPGSDLLNSEINSHPSLLFSLQEMDHR